MGMGRRERTSLVLFSHISCFGPMNPLGFPRIARKGKGISKKVDLKTEKIERGEKGRKRKKTLEFFSDSVLEDRVGKLEGRGLILFFLRSGAMNTVVLFWSTT